MFIALSNDLHTAYIKMYFLSKILLMLHVRGLVKVTALLKMSTLMKIQNWEMHIMKSIKYIDSP